MNYLYDTNVFIHYLKGNDSYQEYFEDEFLKNNTILFSIITRIELLSFKDASEKEIHTIRNLLQEFEIIPLIPGVENLCIAIRKKNSIRIPDSIILASAIYTHSRLVTADIDLAGLYEKTRGE